MPTLNSEPRAACPNYVIESSLLHSQYFPGVLFLASPSVISFSIMASFTIPLLTTTKVKSMGSKFSQVRTLGHSLMVMWSWASDLTSLYLSFSISKMRIIVVLTTQMCED